MQILTREARWGKSWGGMLMQADILGRKTFLESLDIDECEQLTTFLTQWQLDVTSEMRRRLDAGRTEAR